METPASPSETTKNRRIIATLALALLLASLGTSIANIALPRLALAFDAPFVQVQGVVIAYLGALTVLVVAAGRLGDMHGLRRMLVAGLALFAVGSLLCGLAPTLPLLIAARVLQGAGAAFLMALSLALVRERVPEGRTGRAMGLLGTVSAVGTALGPTLGGLVLAMAGWRGVFLGLVPPAVLAFALALIWLPRDEGRARQAVPALALLPGIATLPGLAANLLVAAVMMATLVVGPFYLGRGLGLGEAVAGLVMSVGPALSILGGVPAGRAVDAWGAPRIVMAGLVLMAVGACALVVLPGMLGVAGYVAAIAALTPGYQLFQAANNTAVLDGVPRDRRGTVAGQLSLSRNLGLVAGAAGMGAVFAWGVGSPEVGTAAPEAVARGMQAVFVLAALMMLVAIALVLRRPARGTRA